MSKPDFIIIGAMKSATSSLHEQLALQPGIFMSEPKEPNYFSNDEVYAKGEAWYSSLFAGAEPGDLTGESSTHYTKLPTYPHTIARMQSYGLKSTKFIYVLRHPVDRLVSQYIHEWSQNNISCSIHEALELHPELIEYSLYSKQLQPFVDTFGVDNVLVVFFEDVKTQPQQQLDRICRFIGYEGVPVWHDDQSAANVSSQRVRKFPMYDLLINNPVLEWLRQTFIPKSLRNRVRSMLTLKKRPALTEVEIEKLKTIFDADLARLETFLGYSVSCDAFTRKEASQP